MGQQVKVTRLLDLSRTAGMRGWTFLSKTANYSVTNADSGKTFIATGNSAATVKFTLPLTNATAGCFWNFIVMNIAGCLVKATTTNTIIAQGIAVNASVGMTTINIAYADYKVGTYVTAYSDGTWYYLYNNAVLNTAAKAMVED